MGFFSRKKKGTSTPSSASSTSPRLSSPPQPVVETLPIDPPMTLSVLLDGWTEGRSVQCFNLDISKNANITALRTALALRLGDVSMSLFKVRPCPSPLSLINQISSSHSTGRDPYAGCKASTSVHRTIQATCQPHHLVPIIQHR